ncbi:MAG: CopG family transcriptional regulator [Solirubrobacterales bacterium]
MATRKTHGKMASGKPLTEKMVEKLAKKAEAGYDIEETLRRRPGRPAIGSAPASVESVRLEPELRDALAKRADRDDETTSTVIRKALRQYLRVG